MAEVYQIACCQVEGQGALNFDTAFLQIFNANGDICERTYCYKVLFYVTNKFLCCGIYIHEVYLD